MIWRLLEVIVSDSLLDSFSAKEQGICFLDNELRKGFLLCLWNEVVCRSEIASGPGQVL